MTIIFCFFLQDSGISNFDSFFMKQIWSTLSMLAHITVVTMIDNFSRWKLILCLEHATDTFWRKKLVSIGWIHFNYFLFCHANTWDSRFQGGNSKSLLATEDGRKKLTTGQSQATAKWQMFYVFKLRRMPELRDASVTFPSTTWVLVAFSWWSSWGEQPSAILF